MIYLIYFFFYFLLGTGFAIASTVYTRNLPVKMEYHEYGAHEVSTRERRLRWILGLFLVWPVLLGIVLPLHALIWLSLYVGAKVWQLMMHLEETTRG